MTELDVTTRHLLSVRSSKYYYFLFKLLPSNMKSVFHFLLFLSLVGLYNSFSILTVNSQDLSLLLKQNSTFTLSRGPDTESDSVDVVFNLTNGNPDILTQLPNITNLKQNSSVVVDIVPLGAG